MMPTYFEVGFLETLEKLGTGVSQKRVTEAFAKRLSKEMKAGKSASDALKELMKKFPRSGKRVLPPPPH